MAAPPVASTTWAALAFAAGRDCRLPNTVAVGASPPSHKRWVSEFWLHIAVELVVPVGEHVGLDVGFSHRVSRLPSHSHIVVVLAASACDKCHKHTLEARHTGYTGCSPTRRGRIRRRAEWASSEGGPSLRTRAPSDIRDLAAPMDCPSIARRRSSPEHGTGWAPRPGRGRRTCPLRWLHDWRARH